MAEKVLVELFYTYSKGDGEELGDSYIIEDTPENRQEVLDDVYYDFAMDNEESFVKGDTDLFQYDRYGGDWDEPTGGFVTISTKEDMLLAAEKRYESEKDYVLRMFEGE